MNTQTKVVEEELIQDVLERSIIVFNDDVNTFDHVIDTFIEVLNHTPEQAEQCAWIIHTKGKCKVKTGHYNELEPQCSAILEVGISAEIH